MLINLNYLIEKYKIIFKGILHVGAHECEEINEYEKYLSRNKILWVEAIENKVLFCKKKYNNILIESAVVSDKEEYIKFNVSNNGQSSSFLELELHKINHPHIWYIDSYYVKTQMLKDIIKKYDIDYNFINLDIQGAELKALKGMEEYLHKIDYIYTEVNEDYVYKDCALINEIDEYLKQFGFVRKETVFCANYKWGDAFYIKEI